MGRTKSEVEEELLAYVCDELCWKRLTADESVDLEDVCCDCDVSRLVQELKE